MMVRADCRYTLYFTHLLVYLILLQYSSYILMHDLHTIPMFDADWSHCCHILVMSWVTFV